MLVYCLSFGDYLMEKREETWKIKKQGLLINECTLTSSSIFEI
jgi:hypothetical protein